MAGETILIVEDDPICANSIGAPWRSAGFVVDEAAKVVDALHHLDIRPPDVVVLDLGLPDLDGLTVQQEIAAHAQMREIPVVIVTGSTRKLEDVPVHCILRKPVSPERLVQVVRSCLSSGALGAEGEIKPRS